MSLSGRTVVITRAKAQSATLHAALEAHDATVVEVAVMTIDAPADGGSALRDAVAHLGRYDWIVLTSPNGVDAFMAAVRAVHGAVDVPGAVDVKVAVVGSGTAARLRTYGVTASLVPDRFVAEGLVDAFPDASPVTPERATAPRVLVAQAEAARDVVAEGLRAKGWLVDAVVGYRSVATPVPPESIARARVADAIAFTSASTVERYVASAGSDAVPPVVACIGPVTAAAARRLGIDVAIEAEPHTIDGLVAALATYFALREPRG